MLSGKGRVAMQREVDVRNRIYKVLKRGLVARKAKDMRCVVFCLSKGDEATEVAHR